MLAKSSLFEIWILLRRRTGTQCGVMHDLYVQIGFECDILDSEVQKGNVGPEVSSICD